MKKAIEFINDFIEKEYELQIALWSEPNNAAYKEK